MTPFSRTFMIKGKGNNGRTPASFLFSCSYDLANLTVSSIFSFEMNKVDAFPALTALFPLYQRKTMMLYVLGKHI